MDKSYVSQVDGAYRINGTRVSLDSVIDAFLKGQSPESVVDSFPILTLEQVYGAIAFYLANQAKIDEYLREGDLEFEKLRDQLREVNAELYKKLLGYRNIKALNKQKSKQFKPALTFIFSPSNGQTDRGNLSKYIPSEIQQPSYLCKENDKPRSLGH